MLSQYFSERKLIFIDSFLFFQIDIRFHTITSGGPKFSVVLAGLMVSMVSMM